MDDPAAGHPVQIPQSYVDMPRWWTGGTEWLRGLPDAIRYRCDAWDLRVAGTVRHGSNAVVVPVDRGAGEYVLRLTPPGPETAELVRALRFWAGRGTVHLVDADVPAGAVLLERLALDRTLADVDVHEAVTVLGGMMRRLAVPAPADVPSTADLVRRRAGELDAQWRGLGAPFDRRILDAALDAAPGLWRTEGDLAVDGDLHSAQVLPGHRERWLTVDPVLLRGDIGYDLGRVLWTRLDDMPDDATIRRCLAAAVDAAGLDRDRARAGVLFRTVDYWLWGLGVGLTEDPVRCARLVAALG
ncbi:aminoglycoside phosphotransferase family protein [Actinocatenispora rupis]|uniref:Aminoglycoside O-phosphotransferase n=1 Tax=Actinocatenispora rupis TaxID=519421 RepID=A0A8J3J2L9_9ACTN|nr:aminoglycoside phosphotransferase family protein [Actinocatenispora rupis]GID10960.1 aminoglycoside O-phosphotransferase [Actinocatenispora rupis]